MSDAETDSRRVSTSASLLDGLLAGLDPARTLPQSDAPRNDTVAMALLAFVVLALLLPFVGKAFHIDDPLFIWAAQQIQANPGDPYGFAVNWYGTEMPMSAVNKNPPLASYYIALAAAVAGWSEPALHLAFLLPALAVAIGTYLVARRFCERPLLGALAGVLTPAFLMTGVTVMSDMLMLAFWVFAVHFWIRGLETRGHGALALAGTLIGLAALTKYFAIALIPLLLCYSVIKQRRAAWPLLYLLIPIAALAWYQWTTQQLYGRGLLFDAAAYATQTRSGFGIGLGLKLYTGLAFSGGCIASALLFARQLWSPAALALGALLAALSAALVAWLPAPGAVAAARLAHWLFALQMGIWGTAGIGLLLLAVLDLRRQRDADSLLLALWLAGTFVFAGFVNWTTNGRSLLPMIVPAGILIARLLERRAASRRPGALPAALLPLAAAAALSLAVTWADAGIAEAGRSGARLVHEKHAANAGRVWFQGHWGFQYYMQQRGAKPVDVRNFRVAPGDIVAVPTTNTNLYGMGAQWIALEPVDVPAPRWLATMHPGVGAGYYADVFGPLPFAFGSMPKERIRMFAAPPGRGR